MYLNCLEMMHMICMLISAWPIQVNFMWNWLFPPINLAHYFFQCMPYLVCLYLIHLQRNIYCLSSYNFPHFLISFLVIFPYNISNIIQLFVWMKVYIYLYIYIYIRNNSSYVNINMNAFAYMSCDICITYCYFYPCIMPI